MKNDSQKLASLAWNCNGVAFVQFELVASPSWGQEIQIVKTPFNLFSWSSSVLLMARSIM
jgi:hypothetical protein